LTTRKEGLAEELAFWGIVISTGGDWPEEWHDRMDPETPLQNDLRALIPSPGDVVRILDVGAGPATTVGKKWPGHAVAIVAIDPLASEYNALLREHNVVPPMYTLPYGGEDIATWLTQNYFDLVHARNSLDHSADPVKIIEQMLGAVKPGGCVYLQHTEREATKQGRQGLHQFDLYGENGAFFVEGPEATTNISLRFEDWANTIVHQEAGWVYATMWRKP
jgi:SAM-dependent methyltransferase